MTSPEASDLIQYIITNIVDVIALGLSISFGLFALLISFLFVLQVIYDKFYDIKKG